MNWLQRALGFFQDLPLYDAFLSGSSGNDTPLNTYTALGLSAYWRGVSLIANRMVELPLEVVTENADGEVEAAANHPLQGILADGVAPWLDGTDFVRLITVHMNLHGNSYWQIQSNGRGVVEQLTALDPERIKPVVTDGELRYRLSETAGIRYLPAEEVFHVKGLSRDGITGLSPIDTCASALRLALHSNQYGLNFFTNSGRPATTLMVDPAANISEEQAELIKQRWLASFGGDNSGGVAVMNAIKDVKPVSSTPEESQFLQTRIEAIRDVGRILGVPSQLIGDPAASTYNNVQSMNRQVVSDVLVPLATQIVSAINKQLLGKESGYRAMFNFEAAVQEPMVDRFNSYRTALAGEPFMTVSEVRMREGLAEMEPDFDVPDFEDEQEPEMMDEDEDMEDGTGTATE